MNKNCIHCHHPNDLEEFNLNWEAVCAECGRLVWIRPGQLRPVRVTSLSEFGAHVDVGGGTRGLIHISELSAAWQHPSETIKVDDWVTAVVLHVDQEKKLIGLSLRRVPQDAQANGD